MTPSDMDSERLNRREFTRLSATSLFSAATLLAASSSAPAQNAAAGAASTIRRTVKFRDGTIVPALGQGSARLGKGRHPQAAEEEALRTGLSLGMTLIDTAELYGSEELIGRAIAGQRDRVFLVSKVWQTHVAGDGIARACEASLARLGTDHLDLYLLHWPQKIVGLSSISRRSKACARRARFALGASRTSRFARWTSCSACQTATAARQTRSPTASAIEALSVICCRGASGRACQSWRIRRWAVRAPNCWVIPRWRVSVPPTVARQPQSRSPGPFVAARSLRSPNPVR